MCADNYHRTRMGSRDWRDNWEVVDKLSGGGQGYTHTVRRRGGTDSAIYVLKTLKDQQSDERRARLYAEAAALRTLDHPCVAHLVDTNSDQYNEPSTKLYIVTQYIDGQPMSRLSCPVAVEDACACVDGVLDALSYCHKRGHLHRDLKPDNVILRNGNVREPVLIDFGQTFNAESPVEGFETETGQQLGNRFLHLPELMTSGADKRNALSDISFCVGLLFFLLTGQKPEALRDHQQRRPDEREPARQHLARLPEQQRRQLTRIFAVGFSQEFELRWPSIDALRSEIRNVIEPHAVTTTLAERLKTMKEAMRTDPEHAMRNKMMEVHTALCPLIEKTFLTLQTELQPIIHASRGGIQFDAAKGEGKIQFQFRHTQYGTNCSITVRWQRVRGQMQLLGVDVPQAMFRAKEVKDCELKTVSFADPDIVRELHNALETFVGEQLQGWLDRLAHGDRGAT